MKDISIYIHIPFCRKKCNYCHFYSLQLKNFNIIKRSSLTKKYFNKIIEEIKFYKDILNYEKINSIYIGGGTPSSINTKFIKKILYYLKDNFNFSKDIEITLEINPYDINEHKLKFYKKIGINRLSVGLQSLNYEDFIFLGRNLFLRKINFLYKIKIILSKILFKKTYYIIDELINKQLFLFYLNKLNLVKKYFDNFSVDFILGLKYFDLNLIKRFIIINSIPHLSFYMFMLTGEEKNYVFYSKIIDLIDETSTKQYGEIQKSMKELGYINYEISNFAKEKKYFSKHNLIYWKRKNYLGIGASSSGFINNLRYKNYDLFDYLKIDFNGNYKEFKNKKLFFNLKVDNRYNNYFSKIYKEYEILAIKDIINEEIMLGLRLKEGLYIKKLKEKFNYDILKEKFNKLDELIKNNFIKIEDDFIKINEEYFIISNYIISELFI